MEAQQASRCYEGVAGKQLVTAERLARNEVEADPRVPPAIQFALKKPRSIMHYYGIKQKRLRDEKEPVEDSSLL